MVQSKPVLPTWVQDDFWLQILKSTESENTQTGPSSDISTGTGGEFLLPPLIMLRKKSTNPEATTTAPPLTHNESTCDSDETIDSTSEVDLFSLLLLWILYVLFCLVYAMSLCASVCMCFVVTCWLRADL